MKLLHGCVLKVLALSETYGQITLNPVVSKFRPTPVAGRVQGC